ncbi:Eukaryotic translation initiation factor 3 subunit D [Camellia lanceoleosa]|nr:Eukaryotic translation initiation factor 3 subunit D [Camellia lanceoleosa]
MAESSPIRAESMVVFDIGAVRFNPNGWGPPESSSSTSLLPNHPTNVPSPLLSLRQARPGRRLDPHQHLQPNPHPNPQPSDSVFDFTGDDSFGGGADDDSSFRLVDGKPPPRPRFGPRWRFQQHRNQLPNAATKRSRPRNARPTRNAPAAIASTTSTAPAVTASGVRPRSTSLPWRSSRNGTCSIRSLSTFTKLSFSVPDPEDLLLCGSLEFYDRSFDRITPKNARPVEWFKNRHFFKGTTTDDPIIRRLANVDKATVFATDSTLSTLMCALEIETQRGAVLATELKNNANKLAKWTAQALLASADMMKLGYVSRVHPRDHFNHVILAVVGYKPRDFAGQINLNTSNMWGIVKSIVVLCMKLNEGKYVLVKEPSKPQVRIYEVPVDAFENDYVEEPLPED